MTPPRSKHFTGRSQELMAIHDQLGSPTSSNNDQLKACIIHGLGGVGKTELAIEYSWLYGNNYDLICWVCATGCTKSEEDFHKLGHRIHKIFNCEPDSVEAIRSCLEVEGTF